MLTSFTDSRRRVWNVGDYAVCRVFNPPARLLSCHVAAIREPVDGDGRRSIAVDVALYVPSTNRVVPYTVSLPASQLFPSFDTFNAEEADENRASRLLQNCSMTAGDPILQTIAEVHGWLIHENDFTLANWQEYLHATLDRLSSYAPGASSDQQPFASADLYRARGVLEGLANDVQRDRVRRYNEARGPITDDERGTTPPPCMRNAGVVFLPNRQGCDTSTTTSTTTTTARGKKGRKGSK